MALVFYTANKKELRRIVCDEILTDDELAVNHLTQPGEKMMYMDVDVETFDAVAVQLAIDQLP